MLQKFYFFISFTTIILSGVNNYLLKINFAFIVITQQMSIVRNMNILNNGIKEIKDIAAETLWPTRCAICDKQGFLLCPNCASKLKFIDQNKTCEICGEPFGKIQCCSCNPIDKTLSEKEKLEFKLGFDKCLSVCFLNKETGRIVVLNKDAGERRLSYVMAYFISKAIPKN